MTIYDISVGHYTQASKSAPFLHECVEFESNAKCERACSSTGVGSSEIGLSIASNGINTFSPCMVEGPEYRRHAELLQILVGQRLCRVLRAHPALAATLTSELIGLRVLRVFSVGKELFAVFESRKQIEVEDEAARQDKHRQTGPVHDTGVLIID